MTLSTIDDRFRLTLPRKIRKALRLEKGQKIYVVAAGDTVVMKILAKDPSEKLADLLGEFRFDRKARRKAEKWLLKEASKSI